jgi:hypothetical protein
MKIELLEIKNFRGIREARFHPLGDTIVIAGPNGSGKSCVFDAIRFLKSLYGGYQQNEVHHFLGEFQLNPSNMGKDVLRLFNDKTALLQITISISFSDEEKSYLTHNANELLSDVIWRSMYPEAFSYGFYSAVQYSAQFRERLPEVQQKVAEMLPAFTGELSQPTCSGQLTATPAGELQLLNSLLLSVAFNAYRPPHLGVIDYHGPLRMYTRENVQNITLSFEQNTQEQKKQTALYNYNAKYGNVKGEMAAAYVKDALSKKANPALDGDSSLTETLESLFLHFFPDKKFSGPEATKEGNLNFPVRIGDNSFHDLDELSSGEKEVLYGYLRMRNSAPKHSIILLDEPELHLNPRLISGLPQFYRQHLSLALHNQMWLVSHSDALLREVVGREGYDVFHMLPATSTGVSGQQLRRLTLNEELEAAIVDLVGDVAAYRPGAKAVILEGSGDSAFDRKMVGNLFPELANSVNLISGANKVRVQALVEVLDRAQKKGDFPTRFFAIVDRDLHLNRVTQSHLNQFSWDAYHIENYLMQPKFISQVLQALDHAGPTDESAILDSLRAAAREVLPKVVRHALMDFANKAIVGAIDVGVDPAAEDIAGSISAAVERSLTRMTKKAQEELKADHLAEKRLEIEAEFNSNFGDGSWLRTLPGREILKRYVERERLPVGYDPFRNLVLGRMTDDNYQPAGMKAVVDQVLAA